MIFSNPSVVQILIEFESQWEREEFEQWLQMAATLNWTTSSPPASIAEPTTPLRHAVLSDQKLSQLEQRNEDVRREHREQEQLRKKNREGLLPWDNRPR